MTYRGTVCFLAQALFFDFPVKLFVGEYNFAPCAQFLQSMLPCAEKECLGRDLELVRGTLRRLVAHFPWTDYLKCMANSRGTSGSDRSSSSSPLWPATACSALWCGTTTGASSPQSPRSRAARQS
jgi:hypothetical protein